MLLYTDFQEERWFISLTYVGNITFPFKPFPFLYPLSSFPLFELSDHITDRLLCGSHIRIWRNGQNVTSHPIKKVTDESTSYSKKHVANAVTIGLIAEDVLPLPTQFCIIMSNMRYATSFNPSCNILWCEAKILKLYTPEAKIFTSVFTAIFRDIQNTLFFVMFICY